MCLLIFIIFFPFGEQTIAILQTALKPHFVSKVVCYVVGTVAVKDTQPQTPSGCLELIMRIFGFWLYVEYLDLCFF